MFFNRIRQALRRPGKRAVVFETDQFNKIFPFHLLINNDLTIATQGQSLEKVVGGNTGRQFSECYRVLRPEPEEVSFEGLRALGRQLVVIDSLQGQKPHLRGQFEYLATANQLLFIGSPWYESIEQVMASGLTLHDFASHDPQIDLLHVLKAHEITQNDLKELIHTINRQKVRLKEAAREIHDIALFPMQNPDPLIRIDVQGRILLKNIAAERLATFCIEDGCYEEGAFWQRMVKVMDLQGERWTFEAHSGDKVFSFVCKYFPAEGYINIYGRDVTREKQSQQELKRIALVASASEHGVVFTDAAGRIIWANEGFLKLTGYSKEEVLGKTPIELCKGPLSDRGVIREMVDTFTAGSPFDVEVIHYRKDGSWFWGRSRGQALPDKDGRVMEYFSILEDVTLKRKQEEQLKVLSLIAEDNINSVVVTDADARILWVNKSFTKITGYTLDEVVGRKPGHVLQGPDTDPETVLSLRAQVTAREPFRCEILNYKKCGEPFWFRIQGQPIKNKKGVVTGFFAMQEDITSFKEQKEQIKLLSLIAQQMQSGVVITNVHHRIIWMNDSYANMLGYNEAELLGASPDFIEGPDSSKEAQRYIREQIKNLQPFAVEMVSYKKDGTTFWAELNAQPLEDERGRWKGYFMVQNDISKRKADEQALQRKEQKYRSIITTMNLGMTEVDREGVIKYVNKGLCDMSGYTAEELIGRKASFLGLTPGDAEKLESKIGSRMAGVMDSYEIKVQKKTGEPQWWLNSGGPRYGDNGEVIGAIGVHLNITTHKSMEAQLVSARDQAEASARAKEVFLANMSHEIRTPMNAIMGMAGQLAKTGLDQTQQFYLGTIHSAAENLLVIINDILDLSKIDAGKLTLEHIGFNFKSCVKKAMMVLAHKAEEKGLQFSCTGFEDGLSSVFLGDPYRLHQVLLNLLSNAIKFTNKGSVVLVCRVLEDKAASQLLELEINDTGIGMEQDFLAVLFEKFRQEDNSNTRKYGGTGLGMSISKDLVELMGGRVSVRSRKGEGTRVSIILEFEKGTANDLPPKTYMTGTAILENKRILVVDDNDLNRLLAATILNSYGAGISEAVNGQEAVDMLRTGTFDLVLMDVQMPVLDGIEATRIIRSSISKRLPVIALTADAFQTNNNKCLEAGMSDFITKPFREEDMVSRVALWLEKQEAHIPKEAKADSSDMDSLYDISSLEAISRGNKEFVLKMVKMFADMMPPHVEEMLQFYQQGDGKSMGGIAHKIKPSIDSLGILSLKETIRAIENAGKSGEMNEDTGEQLQVIKETMGRVAAQMKSDFGF